MENNFNIQRDGFKLNSNSFERRNNFNSNFNNMNSNFNNQEYKSLDGRTFTNKNDTFAANKQYYQKMLDESRKKL